MEVVSPELVLVSPPEEAADARRALPAPRPTRYERPRPRLRALAILYAACILVTALPVAFLLVAQR